MLWRLLGIVGSRRLTNVLLLGLAGWLMLLIAWGQTSPGDIVRSIGTMWTYRVVYGILAANLLACFAVELPRTWRRCARRAVPSGMFPPAGFSVVDTRWADLAAATDS